MSDEEEVVMHRADSNNPLNYQGNSNFYRTEKGSKVKSIGGVSYNTVGPRKQNWIA